MYSKIIIADVNSFFFKPKTTSRTLWRLFMWCLLIVLKIKITPVRLQKKKKDVQLNLFFCCIYIPQTFIRDLKCDKTMITFWCDANFKLGKTGLHSLVSLAPIQQLQLIQGQGSSLSRSAHSPTPTPPSGFILKQMFGPLAK